MAHIFDAKLLLRYGGKQIADHFQQLSETEVVWYEDYPVATATTDGEISLGSITTADVFYIYSDQQITYKLNGADTACTLDAGRFHLHWGDAVTALTITNASGSTAYLKILFAGA